MIVIFIGQIATGADVFDLCAFLLAVLVVILVRIYGLAGKVGLGFTTYSHYTIDIHIYMIFHIPWEYSHHNILVGISRDMFIFHRYSNNHLSIFKHHKCHKLILNISIEAHETFCHLFL